MNNPFSPLIGMISACLGIPGFILIYQGVAYSSPLRFISGCAMVLLATLMHICGWRDLSPNPDKPERKVGLITFLGKRTDIVVEGLVLIARYLTIDLIEFVIKLENFDIQLKNIRCAGESPEDIGGLVEGPVSINFRPDTGNLKTFADIGGVKGAENILEDVAKRIAQKRAKGIIGPGGLTWQQMEASGDEVSGAIWKYLTGATMPREKAAIFKRIPGVNTVPSLGIVLESINSDFNGVEGLRNAASETAEAEQHLKAETLRARKHAAIANIYHDAMNEKGNNVPYNQVLDSVRELDLIEQGAGRVFRGNVLGAAVANNADEGGQQDSTRNQSNNRQQSRKNRRNNP